ncbi:hypothetical protein [Spirosoma oryzicola]|uniref:hypothetical protein n=1 Tax=Spirosoma oryzicola TaxID=2898794 RepID=UPI001E5D239E|nr:hypothetical protein [Spirosoma oryzicola]UHG93214.1 hypothetical protein LQ777_10015 [Spirosoma oryzicola]
MLARSFQPVPAPLPVQRPVLHTTMKLLLNAWSTEYYVRLADPRPYTFSQAYYATYFSFKALLASVGAIGEGKELLTEAAIRGKVSAWESMGMYRDTNLPKGFFEELALYSPLLVPQPVVEDPKAEYERLLRIVETVCASHERYILQKFGEAQYLRIVEAAPLHSQDTFLLERTNRILLNSTLS